MRNLVGPWGASHRDAGERGPIDAGSPDSGGSAAGPVAGAVESPEPAMEPAMEPDAELGVEAGLPAGPPFTESLVEGEGQLTALVRRWMADRGTGQEVRPRLVPDQPDQPDQLDQPDQVESSEELPVHVSVAAVPHLPRRVLDLTSTPVPGSHRAAHVTRLAVLIDAQTTSSESASALLERLADRGSVSVCRAYADWARPELLEWATRMRHHGLHSFHHFADDQEETALVAMVIDAVDIAREAAVDVVVVAGHLESTLPLVNRLHVAGIQVIGVGEAHTPHEVRAACDEFLVFASLNEPHETHQGRHRA